MQFVDEARRALEAADREDQAGGATAAAPKDPSQRMLRTFLETFISEEFLPEVYVNYRCAQNACMGCSRLLYNMLCTCSAVCHTRDWHIPHV